MGFHDAEPQPGPMPVGDPAQEIRDSFQAVLDALDAARADLHTLERQQRPPGDTAKVGVRAGHPGRVPEEAGGGPPIAIGAGTHRSTIPQRRAEPTARLDAPSSQSPVPPETVHAPARQGSRGHRRFIDRRHTRVAGALGLGAVSGLILASALLGNEHTAAEKPPGSMGQWDRPLPGDSSLPEIPGTGVLRPGDSGHGVYELQVRLLQIPHVYDGGAVNGRYDTEVSQAVARFQKRYGIHGDEIGVYGDATRHALMLRTK